MSQKLNPIAMQSKLGCCQTPKPVTVIETVIEFIRVSSLIWSYWPTSREETREVVVQPMAALGY